jgi:chemotaxis response regulator CheB
MNPGAGEERRPAPARASRDQRARQSAGARAEAENRAAPAQRLGSQHTYGPQRAAPSRSSRSAYRPGGRTHLREIIAKLDADLPPTYPRRPAHAGGFTEEFAHSLHRICPPELRKPTKGPRQAGRIQIAPATASSPSAKAPRLDRPPIGRAAGKRAPARCRRPLRFGRARIPK